MKKLKHIKLFEAFESSKLSGVLKFIKDKDKFLELLKKVCNTIDFPYSKLSDDFFEYLPFKKALYKNITLSEEKCEAESNFMGGEFCKNGLVKRPWGKNFRYVTCDACKGTGIKPEKHEVKLIKFWFDIEGKFVQTTGVDGKIRKSQSTGIGNYIKVRPTNSSDYRGLPTGTPVLLNLDGDVMGHIYRDSGGVYLIQNKKSGSEPYGRDWKKYGKYSWALGEYDLSRNGGYLLVTKPVEDENVKVEVDPYTFNGLLNIGYGNTLRIMESDTSELIKGANFALILDIDKLKRSSFEKLNKIKSSREESKKDSLFLKKSEDIKKENIKRYLLQISNSTNVSGSIDDLKNCNRLVNKLLGGRNMLYFIHPDSREYNVSHLDTISTKMFKMFNFLEKDDIVSVKEYANSINYSLPSYVKSTSECNVVIIDVINYISKNLKEPSHKEVFNLINELRDVTYQNISSYKIDTLEDFESVIQQINFIVNLLSTPRYPNIRKLNRYFSRIAYNSPSNTFDTYNAIMQSVSLEDLIMELKTIIRLIKKHRIIN
jgi:hypothetical protein